MIDQAAAGANRLRHDSMGVLAECGLDADTLSTKSRLILTRDFCGFANFGSMHILFGGQNALYPNGAPKWSRPDHAKSFQEPSRHA